MAYRITSDCNLCDACVTECPNEAITAGASIYTIDPAKCTECVGFFGEAQCAAVCPQECCEPDPDRVEPEAALLERARSLHPEEDFSGDVPSRFSEQ
ncbi:MAG TPA: YfhL family 4Fe-4S dicluster ferredoxin [Rhodanobacter sp.]|nr:YfhL family 4Fe-4S dicluster ferredoxin [Rhodanobacter sp.]